jgi:hypothetical protein
MIIDWPVTAGDGGRTYLTIPPVILQRLVDGQAPGIALTPLGSIEASFYAREERGGTMAARLLFNIQKGPGIPSRDGEGIRLEDPRPWRGDPRSGGNRTTGPRGSGDPEALPEQSRRERREQ